MIVRSEADDKGMIRTDKEFEELKLRLSKAGEFLDKQRNSLETEELSTDEIERVMAPTISFTMQLQEELEFYMDLKAGKLPSVSGFATVGQMLVAHRIAKGLTQRALAERLNVTEAQVARDERNEYHGVTTDRVRQILDALESKS
jgi:hypothetical protein